MAKLTCTLSATWHREFQNVPLHGRRDEIKGTKESKDSRKGLRLVQNRLRLESVNSRFTSEADKG